MYKPLPSRLSISASKYGASFPNKVISFPPKTQGGGYILRTRLLPFFFLATDYRDGTHGCNTRLALRLLGTSEPSVRSGCY